jgi:hypothetical protein
MFPRIPSAVSPALLSLTEADFRYLKVEAPSN